MSPGMHDSNNNAPVPQQRCSLPVSFLARVTHPVAFAKSCAPCADTLFADPPAETVRRIRSTPIGEWTKESLQVVRPAFSQESCSLLLTETFTGVATRAHIRLRKQCWHRSTTPTKKLAQLTRRAKSSIMNTGLWSNVFLMTADDIVPLRTN